MRTNNPQAEKSDMPYRDLIKVAQEELRKFEKALAIKGTDARTSKERVEKWLYELGY